MSDIQVPIRKFLRLFDYLETIGLDVIDVGRRCELSYSHLKALSAERTLSMTQYTLLYREAAREMNSFGLPLPWAAGIGSEAFELMCDCIITCKTLGEALDRAARFERLLYPVNAYRVDISRQDDTASLKYHFDMVASRSKFAPEHWDRAQFQETAAKGSGLLIWHSFCGWLIGRSIECVAANIGAPFLNEAYAAGFKERLHCPVCFDCDDNELLFSRDYLDYRLVQTPDTLTEFLENAIYQLTVESSKPASTSAAIKSLVRIDFANGMPSFAEMAENLHMSESSLRRRLLKENTNYQTLKDQIRCDLAVENLRQRDMKISELSDYLGFTEPSSFVRSFRNWTGVTPKVYRDNMLALADDLN